MLISVTTYRKLTLYLLASLHGLWLLWRCRRPPFSPRRAVMVQSTEWFGGGSRGAEQESDLNSRRVCYVSKALT